MSVASPSRHTQEEGFHIAFEFGDHILAVECLPQNYPAIDLMVYKRQKIGLNQSPLWSG